MGASATSTDAFRVGQALNATKMWTDVFPASKKQLEADNAALIAKTNMQDSRLNQQDVTIAALVKQVNSLTPVSAHHDFNGSKTRLVPSKTHLEQTYFKPQYHICYT